MKKFLKKVSGHAAKSISKTFEDNEPHLKCYMKGQKNSWKVWVAGNEMRITFDVMNVDSRPPCFSK
jgi:hypothetical protein